MIFKPASRYPVDPRATFVLALSVMSGILSLVVAETPDSLRSAMPDWAVLVWAILLIVGSAVAVIGMAFRGVGGVITEQIGNMTVAVTTIFYATLAVYIVGSSAIFVAGIIGAWGLACFIRWLQLQMLIDSAYRTEKHSRKIRREIQRARGQ